MPTTHIPAVAVAILRSALLSQLGVPAGELDEACMSPNKEKHPERFLEPLQALDAHRVVLDAIGWQEPDKQEPVSLDIGAHRAVIAQAMRTRLEVKGAAQQRETASRNACVIEEFLAANGLTVRE
jgi:hypothetical protein